jgi:antirestriction protein ArdC
MDSTDRKTELLNQLAEGVARLTASEAWQAWLRVQRRFHRYSWGNALLINLQRPNATQVAGFHSWLRLGRHVRQGEKGIAIFAPIVHRVHAEDPVTGEESVIATSPKTFRIAYVFDVAQTEGEELPSLPVSKLQGSDFDGLYPRLVEVAESIGLSVQNVDLDGSRNGDCNHDERRIRIEARNEPCQQVKTLAHELAHAILHGERHGLVREVAELEAESVAYVVCADLGIDSSQYSFAYLATWAGGSEETRRAISESAQRIQAAAALILGGGKVEQP